MPNFQAFTEQYQARSEPIDTGMDSCRTNLTMYHRDTLLRYLPKGIRVRVYDENGGTYDAKTDDFGKTLHYGVKCGMISWQLMRDENQPAPYYQQDGYQLTDNDETIALSLSDGYVLIEANGEKTKDPRYQLADPLQVFVSVNENEVHAKYLPPPMLCNLRFRQQNRQAKLPEPYLKQIKHYGDAVTFFIHGYNVALGKLGEFPTADELGKKPVYFFNAPKPEDVQRPYLHYLANDIEQYVNTKSHAYVRTKSVDKTPKAQFTKQADEKLNGKNALSWYPNVEYYLNLAASGQDELREFTRWEDYSRIVGVTWSGSVDPSMVFFRAEMYANEAGHQFAFILRDLIKENIRINIITHSLGARVALSALNILGDHPGFEERIDNLIMWEAAVADNALTGNYNKENNPIAMELFPYAHKAVKHISVVASDEDGVLGGDFDFKRAGADSYTGLVGGAYPKKYSNLASDSLVLGGGLSALLDYYHHNEVKPLIGQIYQGSRDGTPQMHPNSPYAREIKEKIRHLFRSEADEINKQADKNLIPSLERYNYLKPWSHYRYFYPDILEHIVETFCDALFNGMATNDGVRQALGFVAGEYTMNKRSKYYDKFITDLFENKKLSFNPQTIMIEEKEYPYFLSHSAMRDYEWSHETIQSFRIFDLIYSETYKGAIMEQIQNPKIGSWFGKYK